jgi:hypothetical protein
VGQIYSDVSGARWVRIQPTLTYTECNGHLKPRHLPRAGQVKHACITPRMMRPGIDPRNSREVSGAHSESRVGIRNVPHVGRLRGRPSNSADQCRRATIGRGCSQFSETFEVEPVAGPPREPLPPTLPWRVAVGSAAAGFAGCSDPRMRPTASSNRCRPCRAVGNYGPSRPSAIVGIRGSAWPK